MVLKDKVVVVTGAGNGVGRELTIQLLALGAKVACIDINSNALAETLRLANAGQDHAAGYTVDITDQVAVKALPNQIEEQFDGIDVLINNAGIIHPFRQVPETDDATIEKVIRVNFFGALNMTKAFLPALRARQSAYIVNLSSAGALSPMPGETIYGASKAAVRLLTEGLQLELRQTGIRVMAVFPGGINTNIIQNSEVAVASSVNQLRERLAFLLLTPQKVARRILKGIGRNQTRLVLGIDAVVMDVLSRISPRLAPRMIYSFIDRILSPHIRIESVLPEK